MGFDFLHRLKGLLRAGGLEGGVGGVTEPGSGRSNEDVFHVLCLRQTAGEGPPKGKLQIAHSPIRFIFFVSIALGGGAGGLKGWART